MASDYSPTCPTSITPGQRRRKAYSVSLQDNNFDISEVHLLDHEIVNIEEPGQRQNSDSCPYCGQELQSREEIQNGNIGNFHRQGNHLSSSLPSATGRNLPVLAYGSIRGSDDEFPTTTSSLDHCHDNRQAKPDTRAKKKLIIASALCLVFMVGEIVGGYLANSLAIATDAAHLLTDFASFMISLFSLFVASRPATKKMSFGWYRAEVIGALTSVIMIWVVTGVLVYMAIQRLVNRDVVIDADVMLITSGIGVAFNLIMGCTLHQHGHSHGGAEHKHSHAGYLHSSDENHSLLSHSHSHYTGDDVENINVRAAFIHVVGDFVQSLGVFIAALVIYFKPDWVIIDPICTFLFSILVLFTTIAILKDALTVLMEGLPRGLDFNQVQETFLSIDGVVRVHNLRIWALSMDKIALAAHLAIRPGVKTQQVLLKASRLVRSRFNLFEMTLQIEEFEAGMEECSQCQGPED